MKTEAGNAAGFRLEVRNRQPRRASESQEQISASPGSSRSSRRPRSPRSSCRRGNSPSAPPSSRRSRFRAVYVVPRSQQTNEPRRVDRRPTAPFRRYEYPIACRAGRRFLRALRRRVSIPETSAKDPACARRPLQAGTTWPASRRRETPGLRAFSCGNRFLPSARGRPTEPSHNVQYDESHGRRRRLSTQAFDGGTPSCPASNHVRTRSRWTVGQGNETDYLCARLCWQRRAPPPDRRLPKKRAAEAALCFPACREVPRLGGVCNRKPQLKGLRATGIWSHWRAARGVGAAPVAVTGANSVVGVHRRKD